MNSRVLAARWRGDAGQELAAEVLDRIIAGGTLDDLPLERHDGRVDLRGFAIPDPTIRGEGQVTEEPAAGPPVGMRWLDGLVELRGVTVETVDFSGARLDHLRFFDTTLRDCRFDKARCQDWRGWNLTVMECSFAGTSLRGSALGGWYEGHGSHFKSIDFSGTDFRDAVCQGAFFTNCDFGSARLDKVEFGGCEFDRCRFSGPLDEVRFRAKAMIDKPGPGRLDNVDFSGAILRRVEFSGLSLDRVTLPAEGDEHVVLAHFPCVIRRTAERLQDALKDETRELRFRVRALARHADDLADKGVFHVDELGKTPEQQQLARALLHDIERECASGA